jgi:hypothetical protein
VCVFKVHDVGLSQAGQTHEGVCLKGTGIKIFIKFHYKYTLPFFMNTVKSTIPLDVVWLVYIVNVTMLMVD